VRHYAGKDTKTGKARFYYHRQTKGYAVSQINCIEQLSSGEHLNLEDSSLISSGRSPVWLGHQPPTLTTRVQIPATAPSKHWKLLPVYGYILMKSYCEVAVDDLQSSENK
jgi:hypothetical protein